MCDSRSTGHLAPAAGARFAVWAVPTESVRADTAETGRPKSAAWIVQNAHLVGGVAAFLIAAGWFGAASRLGIDGHHQGFFARPALEVLHGAVLYADTWSWYSPFPHYANAAAFAVLGEKLIAMQLVTALVYATSAALIFSIGTILASVRGGVLATVAFLASSPETHVLDGWEWVLLPWPSAWALMFGLAATRVALERPGSQWSQRLQMLVIGVLVGLSVASRITTGLAVAMVALVFALLAARGISARLVNVMLVAVGLAVSASAAFAHSIARLGFEQVYQVQVEEPRAYFTGEMTTVEAVGSLITSFATTPIPAVVLFAVLGGLSAFALLRRYDVVRALLVLSATTMLVAAGTVACWKVDQLLPFVTTVPSPGEAAAVMVLGAASAVTAIRMWATNSRRDATIAFVAYFACLGAFVIVSRRAEWITTRDPFIGLSSIAFTHWSMFLLVFALFALLATLALAAFRARSTRRRSLIMTTIAVAFSFPHLVQLLPVFEVRHVWWAATPLAACGVALATRNVFTSRPAWINSAVVAAVLLPMVALTITGYHAKFAEERRGLRVDSFLDGILISEPQASEIERLVTMSSDLGGPGGSPVQLHFGFNPLYGLLFDYTPGPGSTGLINWSGVDPGRIREYVADTEAVLWVEDNAGLSFSEDGMLPAGYCSIARSDPLGVTVWGPCAPRSAP